MRNDLDAEWLPNADVIECPEGLLVRLEIAGIDREALQILATSTALVITGQRLCPRTGGTAAGFRFRQMEIEYGPFERVLPLPFPVNHRLARSRYRDGLLELELPRTSSTLQQQTVIPLSW